MSGSIYVIRSEPGLVKVGISGNPYLRLMALRSASSVPLHLDFAAETEGDVRTLEQRVHVILAAKRVSGEWFEVDSRDAVAVVLDAADELGLALVPTPPPVVVVRSSRERTKTAQLNIRVTPAFKAAIEKAAAADRRTVASWMALQMSDYLERQGKGPRR